MNVTGGRMKKYLKTLLRNVKQMNTDDWLIFLLNWLYVYPLFVFLLWFCFVVIYAWITGEQPDWAFPDWIPYIRLK